MKRKRFIKLFMSKGYDKRTAVEAADWSLQCWGVYSPMSMALAIFRQLTKGRYYFDVPVRRFRRFTNGNKRHHPES